jgi:hypothetical protein
MRSRCVALHEAMMVTQDTDWFSDPRPFFYYRCLWSTDAHLYYQSC